MDILPFTSSPTTMLRALSAARMRSRLTTSASLKSSEISRGPLERRRRRAVARGRGRRRRRPAPARRRTGSVGLASGALGAGARGGGAALAGLVAAGLRRGLGGSAPRLVRRRRALVAVGMTIASPSLSSRIAIADLAGELDDDPGHAAPVLAAPDLLERLGRDRQRGLAPPVAGVLEVEHEAVRLVDQLGLVLHLTGRLHDDRHRIRLRGDADVAQLRRARRLGVDPATAPTGINSRRARRNRPLYDGSACLMSSSWPPA